LARSGRALLRPLRGRRRSRGSTVAAVAAEFEERTDIEKPSPPSTKPRRESHPDALAALGRAAVRAGIKHGDLEMVREGKKLAHSAPVVHPKDRT
jgi:hypothetical protein